MSLENDGNSDVERNDGRQDDTSSSSSIALASSCSSNEKRNQNMKRPRSITTTILHDDWISPPPPFNNSDWTWIIQGIGCLSQPQLTTITTASDNNNSNVVAINLTDDDASSDVCQLFHHGVLNVRWLLVANNNNNIVSPSIPSVRHILNICYILNSILTSTQSTTSVAALYCSNGKTRCGLIIAAFLKYSKRVQTTLDGFVLFCFKKGYFGDCSTTSSNILTTRRNFILKILPFSLFNFFQHLDMLLSYQDYRIETLLVSSSSKQKQQQKHHAHYLKCITVQGIPVEDCPVLDIWTINYNNEQEQPTMSLIYSSSFEENDSTKYWAEDSGFFLINPTTTGIITNEFCLVFRFADTNTTTNNNSNDPTKIILRYTNDLSFLLLSSRTTNYASCTILVDIPFKHVDVTKRYRQEFVEEDFCISLLLSSSYDSPSSSAADHDYNNFFTLLQKNTRLNNGKQFLSKLLNLNNNNTETATYWSNSILLSTSDEDVELSSDNDDDDDDNSTMSPSDDDEEVAIYLNEWLDDLHLFDNNSNNNNNNNKSDTTTDVLFLNNVNNELFCDLYCPSLGDLDDDQQQQEQYSLLPINRKIDNNSCSTSKDSVTSSHMMMQLLLTTTAPPTPTLLSDLIQFKQTLSLPPPLQKVITRTKQKKQPDYDNNNNDECNTNFIIIHDDSIKTISSANGDVMLLSSSNVVDDDGDPTVPIMPSSTKSNHQEGEEEDAKDPSPTQVITKMNNHRAASIPTHSGETKERNDNNHNSSSVQSDTLSSSSGHDNSSTITTNDENSRRKQLLAKMANRRASLSSPAHTNNRTTTPTSVLNNKKSSKTTSSMKVDNNAPTPLTPKVSVVNNNNSMLSPIPSTSTPKATKPQQQNNNKVDDNNNNNIINESVSSLSALAAAGTTTIMESPRRKLMLAKAALANRRDSSIVASSPPIITRKGTLDATTQKGGAFRFDDDAFTATTQQVTNALDSINPITTEDATTTMSNQESSNKSSTYANELSFKNSSSILSSSPKDNNNETNPRKMLLAKIANRKASSAVVFSSCKDITASSPSQISNESATLSSSPFLDSNPGRNNSSKNEATCYYCGKGGHTANNCSKNKSNKDVAPTETNTSFGSIAATSTSETSHAKNSSTPPRRTSNSSSSNTNTKANSKDDASVVVLTPSASILKDQQKSTTGKIINDETATAASSSNNSNNKIKVATASHEKSSTLLVVVPEESNTNESTTAADPRSVLLAKIKNRRAIAAATTATTSSTTTLKDGIVGGGASLIEQSSIDGTTTSTSTTPNISDARHALLAAMSNYKATASSSTDHYKLHQGSPTRSSSKGKVSDEEVLAPTKPSSPASTVASRQALLLKIRSRNTATSSPLTNAKTTATLDTTKSALLMAIQNRHEKTGTTTADTPTKLLQRLPSTGVLSALAEEESSAVYQITTATSSSSLDLTDNKRYALLAAICSRRQKVDDEIANYESATFSNRSLVPVLLIKEEGCMTTLSSSPSIVIIPKSSSSRQKMPPPLPPSNTWLDSTAIIDSPYKSNRSALLSSIIRRKTCDNGDDDDDLVTVSGDDHSRSVLLIDSTMEKTSEPYSPTPMIDYSLPSLPDKESQQFPDVSTRCKIQEEAQINVSNDHIPHCRNDLLIVESRVTEADESSSSNEDSSAMMKEEDNYHVVLREDSTILSSSLEEENKYPASSTLTKPNYLLSSRGRNYDRASPTEIADIPTIEDEAAAIDSRGASEQNNDDSICTNMTSTVSALEKDALLSAIRSRGKIDQSSNQGSIAHGPNNRNDLLAAIKSRKITKKNNGYYPGSNVSSASAREDNKHPAPSPAASLQNQNVLLSAIRRRGKIEHALNQGSTTNDPSNNSDLLAATKSRRATDERDEDSTIRNVLSAASAPDDYKYPTPSSATPSSQDQNAAVSEIEHIPNQGSIADDPTNRNDLLAAINTQKTVNENDKDSTFANMPSDALGDGKLPVSSTASASSLKKDAMLSAIRSHRKMVQAPIRSRITNVRNDLPAAIKSGRAPKESDEDSTFTHLLSTASAPDDEKYPASSSSKTSPQCKNALLSAIRSRGKIKHPPNQGCDPKQGSTNDGPNNRNDLLAAIKSRMATEDSDENSDFSYLLSTASESGDDTHPASSTTIYNSQNQNALLSAIRSCGKNECASKQVVTTGGPDNRNDLLAAIKSRRATEKTSDDSTCINALLASSMERDKFSVLLTAADSSEKQNDLISAISRRGKAPTPGSVTDDLINRNDLLSAIKSPSSPDEMSEPSTASSLVDDKNYLPLTAAPCSQTQDALLSAIRSRQKMERAPNQGSTADDPNNRNDLLAAIKSQGPAEENDEDTAFIHVSSDALEDDTHRALSTPIASIQNQNDDLLPAIRSRDKKKHAATTSCPADGPSNRNGLLAAIKSRSSADVIGENSTERHSVPSTPRVTPQKQNDLLSAIRSREKTGRAPKQGSTADGPNIRNGLLAAIKSRGPAEENIKDSAFIHVSSDALEDDTHRVPSTPIASIQNENDHLLSAIRSRDKKKYAPTTGCPADGPNIRNGLLAAIKSRSSADDISEDSTEKHPVPSTPSVTPQKQNALLSAIRSRERTGRAPKQGSTIDGPNNRNDLLAAIKSRKNIEDSDENSDFSHLPSTASLPEEDTHPAPSTAIYNSQNQNALLSTIRSCGKIERTSKQVISTGGPDNRNDLLAAIKSRRATEKTSDTNVLLASSMEKEKLSVLLNAADSSEKQNDLLSAISRRGNAPTPGNTADDLNNRNDLLSAIKSRSAPDEMSEPSTASSLVDDKNYLPLTAAPCSQTQDALLSAIRSRQKMEQAPNQGSTADDPNNRNDLQAAIKSRGPAEENDEDTAFIYVSSDALEDDTHRVPSTPIVSIQNQNDDLLSAIRSRDKKKHAATTSYPADGPSNRNGLLAAIKSRSSADDISENSTEKHSVPSTPTFTPQKQNDLLSAIRSREKTGRAPKQGSTNDGPSNRHDLLAAIKSRVPAEENIEDSAFIHVLSDALEDDTHLVLSTPIASIQNENDDLLSAIRSRDKKKYAPTTGCPTDGSNIRNGLLAAIKSRSSADDIGEDSTEKHLVPSTPSVTPQKQNTLLSAIRSREKTGRAPKQGSTAYVPSSKNDLLAAIKSRKTIEDSDENSDFSYLPSKASSPEEDTHPSSSTAFYNSQNQNALLSTIRSCGKIDRASKEVITIGGPDNRNDFLGAIKSRRATEKTSDDSICTNVLLASSMEKEKLSVLLNAVDSSEKQNDLLSAISRRGKAPTPGNTADDLNNRNDLLSAIKSRSSPDEMSEPSTSSSLVDDKKYLPLTAAPCSQTQDALLSAIRSRQKMEHAPQGSTDDDPNNRNDLQAAIKSRGPAEENDEETAFIHVSSDALEDDTHCVPSTPIASIQNQNDDLLSAIRSRDKKKHAATTGGPADGPNNRNGLLAAIKSRSFRDNISEDSTERYAVPSTPAFTPQKQNDLLSAIRSREKTGRAPKQGSTNDGPSNRNGLLAAIISRKAIDETRGDSTCTKVPSSPSLEENKNPICSTASDCSDNKNALLSIVRSLGKSERSSTQCSTADRPDNRNDLLAAITSRTARDFSNCANLPSSSTTEKDNHAIDSSENQNALTSNTNDGPNNRNGLLGAITSRRTTEVINDDFTFPNASSALEEDKHPVSSTSMPSPHNSNTLLSSNMGRGKNDRAPPQSDSNDGLNNRNGLLAAINSRKDAYKSNLDSTFINAPSLVLEEGTYSVSSIPTPVSLNQNALPSTNRSRAENERASPQGEPNKRNGLLAAIKSRRATEETYDNSMITNEPLASTPDKAKSLVSAPSSQTNNFRRDDDGHVPMSTAQGQNALLSSIRSPAKSNDHLLQVTDPNHPKARNGLLTAIKSRRPVEDNNEGLVSSNHPTYVCKNALAPEGKLPVAKPTLKNSSTDDEEIPSVELHKLVLLTSNKSPDESPTGDPALKEDPAYEKYFKMMRMGLPLGAVQNAVVRDGKDPGVMNLDPEKSLKSQVKEETADDGPPLKEDPEYEKYFKMMRMGLPLGAVQNAVVRDGKDPGVMNLDPEKSLSSQTNNKKVATGKKASVKKTPSKPKKPKVRRKKIYWNSLDESKIIEGSIWSLFEDDMPLDKLEYDMKEFESLFTETPSSDKSKAAPLNSAPKQAKEQKKSTQIIEGKRGMNGGIVLARIKHEFSDLATMVDDMESRDLDTTKLKAMQEFLPTEDETTGLRNYLKQHSSSEEAKKAAMNDLCACEKYMVAMMDVEDAHAKFDCIIFRSQYESRRKEVVDEIQALIKACDELRRSDRLRKLMVLILKVGNLINTGGEGDMARGFSLDALLKLNEAKAFDKKTSVLFYLVKITKQNSPRLLSVKEELPSVVAAERVMIDGLSSELKQLRQELDNVTETAVKDGEKKRELAGEHHRKLSLTELSEQKSFVRKVAGVTHYNKMDCEDALTPIERFVNNAELTLSEAFAKEDEMKRTYAGLLQYFGEDESMTSNDFFGIINKFVLEFDAAHEVLKIIEAAKAKEEKARLKEEKAAASKKTKEASNASHKHSVRVLGSMASGNMPLVLQVSDNTDAPANVGDTHKANAMIKESEQVQPQYETSIATKERDDKQSVITFTTLEQSDCLVSSIISDGKCEDQPSQGVGADQNKQHELFASIKSRGIVEKTSEDVPLMPLLEEDERPLSAPDSHHGRALLSVIRSHGVHEVKKSQDGDPTRPNNRSGLLAAIKGRSKTTEDTSDDLVSVNTHAVSLIEMSERTVAIPQGANLQASNALLSSIKNHGKNEKESPQGGDADLPNNRNGMLSEIKSRGILKKTSEDSTSLNAPLAPLVEETERPVCKPDDQNGHALLSAIRSRGERKGQLSQVGNSTRPNGRSDLFSAIKSRSKTTEDTSEDLVSVNMPAAPLLEISECVAVAPHRPNLQAKNALLSTKVSHRKHEKESSQGDDADRPNNRNDMLAAIKSRGALKKTSEESASLNAPLAPVVEENERPVVPQIPKLHAKNALLSALRSRGKHEEDGADTDRPNNRNDMLAAIKSRGVLKKTCEEHASLNTPLAPPVVPQKPKLQANNALLSFIQSHGKNEEESFQGTEADRPNNRNNMQAAIQSRRALKKASEDSASLNAPLAPLVEENESLVSTPDVQNGHALLSTVRSRGERKGKSSQVEDAALPNGQSDLLAAIKSRSKTAEDTSASVTTPVAPLLEMSKCVAVVLQSPNSQAKNALLSAEISRGKHIEKSSQGDDSDRPNNRNDMLAAIKSRGALKKTSEESASLKAPLASVVEDIERPSVPQRSNLLAKNSLLSAIRSHGKHEEGSSQGTDANRPNNRNDMLAAIQSRGVLKKTREESAGLKTPLAPPVVPQKPNLQANNAFLSAIRSRGQNEEELYQGVDADTPNNKNNVLAAIESRGALKKTNEESASLNALLSPLVEQDEYPALTSQTTASQNGHALSSAIRIREECDDQPSHKDAVDSPNDRKDSTITPSVADETSEDSGRSNTPVTPTAKEGDHQLSSPRSPVMHDKNALLFAIQSYGKQDDVLSDGFADQRPSKRNDLLASIKSHRKIAEKVLTAVKALSELSEDGVVGGSASEESKPVDKLEGKGESRNSLLDAIRNQKQSKRNSPFHGVEPSDMEDDSSRGVLLSSIRNCEQASSLVLRDVRDRDDLSVSALVSASMHSLEETSAVAGPSTGSSLEQVREPGRDPLYSGVKREQDLTTKPSGVTIEALCDGLQTTRNTLLDAIRSRTLSKSFSDTSTVKESAQAVIPNRELLMLTPNREKADVSNKHQFHSASKSGKDLPKIDCDASLDTPDGDLEVKVENRNALLDAIRGRKSLKKKTTAVGVVDGSIGEESAAQLVVTPKMGWMRSADSKRLIRQVHPSDVEGDSARGALLSAIRNRNETLLSRPSTRSIKTI